MALTHYSPQPFLLPPDGELRRHFHDPRTHLQGKPPLTAQDYANYETHTVFNDIYMDATENSVKAIGPPLVNLKAALFPVELRVGGMSAPLKHLLSRQDRVVFHRFKLPSELNNECTLSFTCRLNNGLQLNGKVNRQTLPRVKLQFVTLQKNNPVPWIIDWLRYCQSLGVDRVLLYDNGSDNRQTLIKALSRTADLPHTVLIDWPFPYGPSHSRYNQFCQASQNNHAHQCFGAAEWIGHFDIDEYPVIGEGLTLIDLVNDASPRCGLLRLDSFWVPNLDSAAPGADTDDLLTVRDFPYRERQPRGKAHKYVARQSTLRMANTHNARVKLGYQRTKVPVKHGAFLHYKSLTNNWKGVRGQLELMDDKQHQWDERVIKRMRRLDGSTSN